MAIAKFSYICNKNVMVTNVIYLIKIRYSRENWIDLLLIKDLEFENFILTIELISQR